MNKIDEHAIQVTCLYFQSKGFKTTVTENQMDHFDILAETPDSRTIAVDSKGQQYPPSVRIAIEVKGRNCDIHQYSDMRVEQEKYNAACKGIASGEFKGAIVVSVYKGDSLGIGNLMIGKATKGWGPKTSHFGDRSWVLKDFWDVPRQLEVINEKGAI